LAHKRQWTPHAAGIFSRILLHQIRGNARYERRLLPRVAPLNLISHDRGWRLIVASAREAKSAQLPIPNLPIGALTQEFYDFDLRLFEPLLHDELHLPQHERCEFIDWHECRKRLRTDYDRAVPSLRPLMNLLELEQKN
jgi:hypothetical protein